MEAGGEWDTFAEQIELVWISLKVNIEKIQFSCLYSVSCPLFHPLQTETRFVFLCDWVLARQVHKSQGPEKLLAARSISVNNFSPPQNRINPLFQHRIAMKIFLLFFLPTPLSAFKGWGEKHGGNNVCSTLCKINNWQERTLQSSHTPAPKPAEVQKNSTLPAAVFGLGPKLRAVLRDAAGWSRSGR